MDPAQTQVRRRTASRSSSRYNQPRMLSEALQSVHEQTLPATEVIVIDDCSAEPLERVTSYPAGFRCDSSAIAPITAPASVVHCIQEARCELIATSTTTTVGAELLERLTGALSAHPEACLAFCDHGIMRADGQPTSTCRSSKARDTRAPIYSRPAGRCSLYESALLQKAVAASSFALVRRGALDPALIGTGSDMWTTS